MSDFITTCKDGDSLKEPTIKSPEPPISLSIQTISDPNNPCGVIMTVAFDPEEFMKFARENPDVSFQVDGCPIPISTASYWAAVEGTAEEIIFSDT